MTQPPDDAAHQGQEPVAQVFLDENGNLNSVVDKDGLHIVEPSQASVGSELKEDCLTCEGRGYNWKDETSYNLREKPTIKCPSCNGSGKATGPVEDTNHRRNTEPQSKLRQAAPEPVESIQLAKEYEKTAQQLLIKFRQDRKLTQVNLSELLLMPRSSISKMENGEQMIPGWLVAYMYACQTETDQSRLLVQAKLEELERLFGILLYDREDNKLHTQMFIEDRIKDLQAALQSQLEGAAPGVAYDKPDVPTGADSGKGKPVA